MIKDLGRKAAGLSFVIYEYTTVYCPPLGKLVMNGYSRPIIKKEGEAAGLCEEDTFLQIGSGSMPYTAYIIASITGAKVDGIDIDRLALRNAEKFAEIYGKEFQGNVDITYGDGADYDVSEYDCIMISLGVEGLEKVFKNIVDNGKKDVRILYREVTRYNNEDVVPSYFEVKETLCHPMFWKTVLLKKKE